MAHAALFKATQESMTYYHRGLSIASHDALSSLVLPTLQKQRAPTSLWVPGYEARDILEPRTPGSVPSSISG